MEIKSIALFNISQSDGLIEEVEQEYSTDDLKEYLENLLNDIFRNPNQRRFKFKTNTTEFKTATDLLLNDDFNEGAEIISQRLFSEEVKAQKRIKHLKHEIPAGIFLISIVSSNNSKKIVLAKADQTEFLDEQDFEKHQGLPMKRKIFKASVLDLDENDSVSSIYIHDTSTPMSKYWWEAFQELEQVQNDRQNTINALDKIDSIIKRTLRRTFKADYLQIRNSFLTYMRNQEEFKIDDYISQNISNYLPVEEDFPKEKIIRQLNKLVDKGVIDNRFTIIKEEITKRRVTEKIQLTDKIDLILNQEITNIKHFIEADTIEGRKFIRIFSDEGFEHFKN